MLAILKRAGGGHKKFPHFKSGEGGAGGGAHEKCYPVLRGGGGRKRFSHFVAHLPLINNQSLTLSSAMCWIPNSLSQCMGPYFKHLRIRKEIKEKHK